VNQPVDLPACCKPQLEPTIGIAHHVTFAIPVYLKLSKPYNKSMQPYNKLESLGKLGHQVVNPSFSEHPGMDETLQ